MATNKVTVKELVDTYLQAKGLRRNKGNDGEASPILPLIMMDMAYQVYKEHIKPIECKHKMKQLKNMWEQNYNAFNKDFFKVYNSDQTDFIIDMMDDFDEYIKKDLTIVFWQFTNVVSSEPMERQKVLAAGLLVNVLCQCSMIVWDGVYSSSKSLYSKNNNLMQCEHLMHQFNDLYYGKNKKSADCNKNEQLVRAVDVLCKHQITFLKRYHVKQ